MEHTPGPWEQEGDYIVDAEGMIAAAPIGYELAEAILASDKDGLNRSEYLLAKANEFIAKATNA